MKTTVNLPEGWHTITPRLVVRQASEFVEFVKTVFLATGEYEEQRPTVLEIGDSKIMINEAGVRNLSPAFLYVYVADTDETFHRAIEAGAKTIEKPVMTPYGDRRCMVEDQWGNTWQIATYQKPEAVS
jgi:PhnB protein